MIDGAEFIEFADGRCATEVEKWYDEDDNLHTEWKDLDGVWHEDVEYASERTAVYYDDWISDDSND